MEHIQATIEQACEAFKVILDLKPQPRGPRSCSQQNICHYLVHQHLIVLNVRVNLLQNPANPELQRQAEQVLLQFRNSQRPIPACQHILQHSHSVEARFHAACTLREALIREWASLLPEEVLQLRTYLLQYSMHHAGMVCAGLADCSSNGKTFTALQPAAPALSSVPHAQQHGLLWDGQPWVQTPLPGSIPYPPDAAAARAVHVALGPCSRQDGQMQPAVRKHPWCQAARFATSA
jgi:hypothetical protein